MNALDVKWFKQIAAWQAPVLDSKLPQLSNAANNSALWVVCAALLAVTGGRLGRRAATRGLASIAASSATVNLGVKALARRQRPTQRVPVARRLRRVPETTSFPSGHAASAAAFATGAAIELPESALVLGPLAAAVAFSRIYTGVHYPSDVAVGLVIGTSVALISTRTWPTTPRATPVPPTTARASSRDPVPRESR
jgi:membrane-associated phospholipid phosphatase